MKKFINDLLSLTVGYRLTSTEVIARKEKPLSFSTAVGKKFLFYQNMFSKIKGIDGSIVECGIGWGRSLFNFSLLSEIDDRGRKIWGFDSFEGFPETSINDETDRTGKGKGHYKTNEKSVIQFLINSGLEKDTLDAQVQLVKGFFPHSFEKYNDEPIALLHLDCDLYKSYMYSLEYFYPLVQEGGVIVFDDYGRKSWPGAKIAVDEFFTGKEKLFKSGIIDRYYFIKNSSMKEQLK